MDNCISEWFQLFKKGGYIEKESEVSYVVQGYKNEILVLKLVSECIIP